MNKEQVKQDLEKQLLNINAEMFRLYEVRLQIQGALEALKAIKDEDKNGELK